MHLPLFCGILIEILSTVALGQEDLVEMEVVNTTTSKQSTELIEPEVNVTAITEEISEATTAFSPWIRPSPFTLTLNTSIEQNITLETISPSINVSDGFTSNISLSLSPENVSVLVSSTKPASTPEKISVTPSPKQYLICYMLTKTCPSYGYYGQYGNQGHHGHYGNQGHHGHYGNQGHHGQYGSKGHHGHYGNQGHHGQHGSKGHHGHYGNQGHHGQYGSKGHHGHYGNQGHHGHYGNQGHHGQYGNQGHHTSNQQCLCPPYAYICYGPYTKIACPNGIHNMDHAVRRW